VLRAGIAAGRQPQAVDPLVSGLGNIVEGCGVTGKVQSDLAGSILPTSDDPLKMRPKLLMTATALPLAALLVLSSAGQAAAVAVCVGLDGHIDVELLLESCCIADGAGPRGTAADLAITGAECGDCTDVQLKAPPLRSKKTPQLQPDGDAERRQCSWCSSTGVAIRTAQIIGMDQRRHALALLSTVVLRT
jgi:hypothetical protein